MSLELFLPELTPTTGAVAKGTRPITSGSRHIVEQKTEEPKSGIFGILDNIGTTVLNGVSDALSAVVDREVNELRTDSESTVTSQGDPSDQPGNVNGSTPQPFYKTYQTELLIGGGLLITAVVVFALSNRN